MRLKMLMRHKFLQAVVGALCLIPLCKQAAWSSMVRVQDSRGTVQIRMRIIFGESVEEFVCDTGTVSSGFSGNIPILGALTTKEKFEKELEIIKTLRTSMSQSSVVLDLEKFISSLQGDSKCTHRQHWEIKIPADSLETNKQVLEEYLRSSPSDVRDGLEVALTSNSDFLMPYLNQLLMHSFTDNLELENFDHTHFKAERIWSTCELETDKQPPAPQVPTLRDTLRQVVSTTAYIFSLVGDVITNVLNGGIPPSLEKKQD